MKSCSTHQLPLMLQLNYLITYFNISCVHIDFMVLLCGCTYLFSTEMQGYVDAVLDLASHFITRLRRYASFCRTLASHAVGASSGSGSSRNIVTSPTNSSPSPANNQGSNFPAIFLKLLHFCSLCRTEAPQNILFVISFLANA